MCKAMERFQKNSSIEDLRKYLNEMNDKLKERILSQYR